ncbi:alpha/beta fold hydrolase [Neptunomonas japonica]|uniref:Arylesterase n=1 Tax=Neptunomonas japonica JAMM 1380 TaxID=1441457 RepID=A0A7R6PJ06_9GAMM|nr:alpha/beta hydrolase [Neptunomonas japonica]BBB29991.1 arylesterase [Neptunomonas japonica JAMM 1380]
METLQTSDNTNIHYISLGSGDITLVFLHGWTASVREWLPFASELAENHRVICWDARGHGDHPHDEKTNMTLPRMADDLDELLEQLDVHNAILIGHSMGALTAWEYIRRHGQSRLNGLCIVDQSPKLVTDEEWQHGVYGSLNETKNNHLIERFKTDFAEGVLELIAFGNNRRSRENYDNNSRGFQHMREHLQKLPAHLLTQCWISITQQDYREVLSKINCPTLLIYGDESQFYSRDLQKWVTNTILDSELLIYPESDHSPHLWHKERFIYDLNRFIDAL